MLPLILPEHKPVEGRRHPQEPEEQGDVRDLQDGPVDSERGLDNLDYLLVDP